MAFTNPSQTDFENQFFRDFNFGTDQATQVIAPDIANAFALVNVDINPSLWPDQPTYTQAYLYLTAHFLVTNLRNSTQGLNGQFNFTQNSKGVSNVNEGFAVPQWVQDHPKLGMYFKTNYGAMYMSLMMPYLIGPIFTVPGRTKY